MNLTLIIFFTNYPFYNYPRIIIFKKGQINGYYRIIIYLCYKGKSRGLHLDKNPIGGEGARYLKEDKRINY